MARGIGVAAMLWLSVVKGAPAGDNAAGKRIYDGRCAFCHGGAGKGDGPAGASLKPPPTNFASADFWKNAGAEQIKSAIANGKAGTAMLGFKASLNGEQIDDVLTYLRTFQPH